MNFKKKNQLSMLINKLIQFLLLPMDLAYIIVQQKEEEDFNHNLKVKLQFIKILIINNRLMNSKKKP